MQSTPARIACDEVGATIVLPGDENWDSARQAWNLAVDQRPAAVALVRSAKEAIEIVGFARRNGLRVATQCTGHGAAPMASLEHTILVKTSQMAGVQIEPGARRVRAQAGALWQDITKPAAEHGLAALAGSSPNVGVVGYSLGGGLSWMARRYGLAAESLLAAELVTANGDLIRAEHESTPDLFWALRGGGGSFGLVTAIELALFPVQRLYAGVLFWPMQRGSEILHAWREWVDTVPDTVTSLARLLRVPPLPDIPAQLRGRPFVVVEAACIGDESSGEDLLAPLRELGPEIDTFAMVSAPLLQTLHMDPEPPVPAIGDGMLLADLPAKAIEGLVAVAGPNSDSPLLSIELRHLGGQLGGETVIPSSMGSAAFGVYSVGMAMNDEMGAAIHRDLGLVRNALSPCDARYMFLNFADQPADTATLFSPATQRRLAEIKARYDPTDVFQANHEVAPALATNAA
jgi:hypothetical protein